MMTFKAAFDIVKERACPYYHCDELLILTDKAVILPMGRPACLILIRELTELMFRLMPHADNNFADQRDTVYSCGGCTGLINFKLIETPKNMVMPDREGDVAISGRIDIVSPTELLQVFHMWQKTGKLLLNLEGGAGRILFRNGGIIIARFRNLDNQDAIHAILAEKQGHFHFLPGLPPSLNKAKEVGDFMKILMSGLKKLDEKED